MRSHALALVAALSFAAAPALAGDVTVKLGHNRIDPAEVTIGVGDTVTWVNEQEMPGGHAVVADDGSFESPGLDVGESYSHTFNKPGRVEYGLKQHPKARGTIVVE